MDLAKTLLRQLDDPKLSQNERARIRCALGKELEEAGNYEGARSALQGLWQRVGERPILEGLDQMTKALVLLRAGTLTGWLGSAQQIAGAQETAKDLLTKSRLCFESLGDSSGAAEAEIEIAWCYWREGAYDEARATLCVALTKLSDEDNDLKAVALIRRAIIERMANRLRDAFGCLTEATSLVEASNNHSLKGRLHVELAVVLRNLSTLEKREDYVDRALVEYTAASFHFEQTGHTRYRALTENNLGYMLFTLRRFIEAHEHLDRARRIFASLKDFGSCAQVDDTRARALLAQGKLPEAERIARSAVRTQEKGGEHAFLAEALTTHAVALARLRNFERARATFMRAIEVASVAGSNEKAGLAAIAFIEEMDEQLTAAEITTIYERAANLLAESQHSETLSRLVSCSLRAIEAALPHKIEFNTSDFIYASPQMAALLHKGHLVAATAGTVLITGETGTGKELLARLIHRWSGRSGAFVAINCGALTETLMESQIFGHMKGSFTDAIEDQVGTARQAVGGTLFLDEVAELSPGNQSKLLRLVEQGEIHTIGAPEPEYVDVRIIAATNKNLKEEMMKKRFRDDLFYRLQTFHLEIPPLRERPEDITVLAEHFTKQALAATGKRVTFSPEAIDQLRLLPLIGNARELRTLIERTVIIAADNSIITVDSIEVVALRQSELCNFAEPWEGCSLPEEVRRYERELISRALRTAKGSVVGAARLLGIKHQTLSFMLRGRHKDLLPATNLAGKRKRSIIRVS